jgi:hypothetical protein
MQKEVEMVETELQRRWNLWNENKAEFLFLGPKRIIIDGRLTPVKYQDFSEEEQNFLDNRALEKIKYASSHPESQATTLFCKDGTNFTFIYTDVSEKDKFFEIFKGSPKNGGKRRRTIKRRKKGKKRTKMRR